LKCHSLIKSGMDLGYLTQRVMDELKDKYNINKIKLISSNNTGTAVHLFNLS